MHDYCVASSDSALMIPSLLQLLLAGIGGGGLVYLLIKTLLTEKIKAGIKNDYDSKLEALKNDLLRQQTALSSSINSQIQAFHAVNDRRVDAIMKYWEDVSRILHFVTISHWADRYLLENEIDKTLGAGPSEKDRNDWIGGYHSAAAVTMTIDQGEQEIGHLRPLIGEQLWYYHFTLRIFSGRIALLYSKDNPSKRWQHWHKDIGLVRVVKQALTAEEAELVLKADLGSVGLFCNIIEQKALKEIGKILSGEIASSNTLQNAQRLQELTATAKSKE